MIDDKDRVLILLDKLRSDKDIIEARIKARQGYSMNANQHVESTIDQRVLESINNQIYQVNSLGITALNKIRKI